MKIMEWSDEDAVEWLRTDDPIRLLILLVGKVSERKMRLFACACCRRIWHLLTDQRSRQAVEDAERVADEPAAVKLYKSKEAAEEAVWIAGDLSARKAARAAFLPLAERTFHIGCCGGYRGADWTVDEAKYAFDTARAAVAAVGLVEPEVNRTNAMASERKAQAQLIRDIFHPFHKDGIKTAWREWKEGTALKIAQAIYDQRSFEGMSILGDALEEAGCDDAELLAHCREQKEHTRGCWVIDLILGKP